MKELKLKGYSNFNVEIINTICKTYVKKTANTYKDYQKLKRQIIKQQTFNPNMKNIKIPEIYDNIKDGFLMEFIDDASFYEYFLYNKNIYDFFQIITKFIDMNILESTICDFTNNISDKIISKYKEILENNTNINKLIEINKIYKYLITFTDNNKILLPCGKSHGDLTLSNIIFNNKYIYLIDFLDNFIETPLQDIVKLRQDTQFNWSYKLNKKLIDNKLTELQVETLNKNIKILDNLFNSYYENDVYYSKFYKFYQIFNFFRILPYSSSEEELTWILDIIKNI